MIVTDLDCWFTLTTDNEERMTGQENGLLPCPFCGGEAEFMHMTGSDNVTVRCGVGCHGWHSTTALAAADWNRRAALAAETREAALDTECPACGAELKVRVHPDGAAMVMALAVEPTRAPDGWASVAEARSFRAGRFSGLSVSRSQCADDDLPTYIGAAPAPADTRKTEVDVVEDRRHDGTEHQYRVRLVLPGIEHHAFQTKRYTKGAAEMIAEDARAALNLAPADTRGGTR